MTKQDPNVRAILFNIINEEIVPKNFIVLQCSGCGEKLFLPPNSTEDLINYWLDIYLNKYCRWAEDAGCQGIYRRIENITLGVVKSWLR